MLKAMVDAILRYEGRINRLLGDAVLAFFGTPLAHENDPERAILAALELRDAVQALGLNVTAGINTGEVYLGAIGAEQHREITAQGPVVNLAARLREKASRARSWWGRRSTGTPAGPLPSRATRCRPRALPSPCRPTRCCARCPDRRRCGGSRVCAPA